MHRGHHLNSYGQCPSGSHASGKGLGGSSGGVVRVNASLPGQNREGPLSLSQRMPGNNVQ